MFFNEGIRSHVNCVSVFPSGAEPTNIVCREDRSYSVVIGSFAMAFMIAGTTLIRVTLKHGLFGFDKHLPRPSCRPYRILFSCFFLAGHRSKSAQSWQRASIVVSNMRKNTKDVWACIGRAWAIFGMLSGHLAHLFVLDGFHNLIEHKIPASDDFFSVEQEAIHSPESRRVKQR